MNNEYLTTHGTILVSIIIILITALVIKFDDGSQWMNTIRIIVGSISLLFLPGRWLTQVFFSKKEIDGIERVALSFALSISVVPLLVFYANLAGVPITEWLVLSIVLLLVIGSILIIRFRK